MDTFIQKWAEAATTTLGFFWMALWAFILGYAISSMIQVFVTEQRMRKAMGEDDVKSISLAAFFGFVSSSCSFSALATTKSIFQKGAGFISSIAFLLASTNLVIELGIVISIFLGWQFVVGEYAGGVLLILISWLLIRIIRPEKLVRSAREHLGDATDDDHEDGMSVSQKMMSMESWAMVGNKYIMEWKMVWKDVTFGFTLAGVIAVFVPDSFFQSLFVGTSAGKVSYDFLTLLQHVIVGPAAAFLTFIGSMGNIPLAALLFGKGVSFAGVMAFIFSDLVVFPVLRINANYYGWKMSLFILLLLLCALVSTSLILHYGFAIADMLPEGVARAIGEQQYFRINYTFYMNMAFVLISAVLVYLGRVKGSGRMAHGEMAQKTPLMEKFLTVLAVLSLCWLTAGIGLSAFLKF